jgi:hypothetical protein
MKRRKYDPEFGRVSSIKIPHSSPKPGVNLAHKEKCECGSEF